MKIGIITHYDVHNHGALLQLNALIQVLRTTFDADAKALQYDKNYDFLGHELKAKYVIYQLADANHVVASAFYKSVG